MAVYHTRQWLPFRTHERDIMTALKNISPAVFDLWNLREALRTGPKLNLQRSALVQLQMRGVKQ